MYVPVFQYMYYLYVTVFQYIPTCVYLCSNFSMILAPVYRNIPDLCLCAPVYHGVILMFRIFAYLFQYILDVYPDVPVCP
jgi:hypothetical protein